MHGKGKILHSFVCAQKKQLLCRSAKYDISYFNLCIFCERVNTSNYRAVRLLHDSTSEYKYIIYMPFLLLLVIIFDQMLRIAMFETNP